MEPEKCAFLLTEQEISYFLLSYILKSQQVEHHSTFQEKFQFVKLDWSISVEVLHCSALARLRLLLTFFGGNQAFENKQTSEKIWVKYSRLKYNLDVSIFASANQSVQLCPEVKLRF